MLKGGFASVYAHSRIGVHERCFLQKQRARLFRPLSLPLVPSVQQVRRCMAKRSCEGEEPETKRPLVASGEPLTAEYYLKNMRLKRIVKENHGLAIRAVRAPPHSE